MLGPRGTDLQAASLRVALVGPAPGSGPGLTHHAEALAVQLREAGHDVTTVSWGEAGRGVVPPLSRRRPDTWVRTGRRLRGHDAVVLVHGRSSTLPALSLQALSVLLRSAGVGSSGDGAGERARAVVLCDEVLSPRGAPGERALMSALLSRVDGVVVHRRDQARLAAELGAPRVYAVERPGDRRYLPLTADLRASDLVPLASVPGTEGSSPSLRGRKEKVGDVEDVVSAPWAAYVGAIEALAAVPGQATPPDDQDQTALGLTGTTSVLARRARHAVRRRRLVAVDRADLPDWVRPTDLLDAAEQADDAKGLARDLGLPRVRDAVEAWAALGALAAVVRLTEQGDRRAVVVDESGPRSALSRWARAMGFAPVDLGLTGESGALVALEVDAATFDVVARLHPNGCDASDLAETLAQASWALRPGGLLVLTLPLGGPGCPLAFGPADVRAAVARAHDVGLVLVGDLDGEVGARLRLASLAAPHHGAPHHDAPHNGAPTADGEDPAYGLVRLTLRRR